MTTTEYSKVFNYSLKKGHIECAKLLYPYVGSNDDINVCVITSGLIKSLGECSKRNRKQILAIINNEVNETTIYATRINECLERYVNVFKFLSHDLNYRITDSDDKIDILMELFGITRRESQLFGSNKFYRQIIETVCEMCEEFSNEDLIESIYYPTTHIIQMIEDMGFLNERNITTIINRFQLTLDDPYYMVAFNIFMKYNGLNDLNVSMLFTRLLVNYQNHTQNFHSEISKFLKFAQSNGFRLTINTIPDISDLSIIELILNEVNDIIINEPVNISNESVY